MYATAPSAPPLTVDHYENFPVASWLCPRHLRAPIAAIYHFARTADDIADEGQADASERLAQLNRYRAALHTAANPSPLQEHDVSEAQWLPVFQALQHAIARYQLPVHLLDDLLDAFTQDTKKSRDAATYADEAELLDYCRRSANPIGRLLLHLYGVHDARSLQQSDAICSALQLINFWQDLSVDIPRGRYYLPDALCARFGYSADEMRAGRDTPAGRALVRHCTQQARALMLQGAPLVHSVPGRAGWELRLVVQGGLRIADKIAALDFGTFSHRPVVRIWDAPTLLWRTLWM